MNECCPSPDGGALQDHSLCATCGKKGKPVKALTIRYLTNKDWSHYNKITDGFFCTNPGDSTVYYLPEQNLIIDKREVAVRVGIKEKKEPIYVCYCYNHTNAAIEEDFLEHGRSTIEDNIRQKVTEKLCSCEFRNPSGRCCLGDVRRAYQHLKGRPVPA